MCWNVEVTAAMVGAGALATALSWRRGDPAVLPLTLGYFTVMEALQLGGYAVIDQCGTPANETFTFLSVLHIVFQPLIVNAFAMELKGGVSPRMRALVFGLCGLSSVIMLMQLFPFDWAGTCKPGSILCADRLCTVTGDWHQAWEVARNGMLTAFDPLGFGFPTYTVAFFGLPLLYGAWRFSLFQMILGPVLAGQLTSNPNEVPAIWCLFSIGLVAVAMVPQMRRPLALRPV